MITSIFVVIVHYNQEHSLMTSLSNLFKFIPKELICVVDNSQTFERLDSFRYIPLNNPGFAAAMNIGVQQMKISHPKIKHALLLSHEVVIDEKNLLHLLNHINSNEDLIAVGPVLYLKSGIPWSFGGTFNRMGLHPKNLKKRAISSNVDWLDGSCVVINVEQFLSLGGYPENYFLYMEDVAFGYMARNAGKQLSVCVESAAEQQSSGTPRYLAIRNSLILSRNYRSVFHTFMLLMESAIGIVKSLLCCDFFSAQERIRAIRDAKTMLHQTKKEPEK